MCQTSQGLLGSALMARPEGESWNFLWLVQSLTEGKVDQLVTMGGTKKKIIITTKPHQNLKYLKVILQDAQKLS